MAHALVWPTSHDFFPIGNTSAVSLTNDLPPDEPARVLQLGCGDPRNILFTIYTQKANCMCIKFLAGGCAKTLTDLLQLLDPSTLRAVTSSPPYLVRSHSQGIYARISCTNFLYMRVSKPETSCSSPYSQTGILNRRSGIYSSITDWTRSRMPS